MLQERAIPRYAHAEGHTDLCFSDDGKYMVTCGSEGDIRIWSGFNDDDPVDKCVGEKAFAVAQKGDRLYVGSDHNNVQIFTFPEAELDGVLTRFTAPVTSISVSNDGGYVAAGSCDMEIHLVETVTSKVTFFQGHKAPILHVTIDPKIEYLASSSCDGTVKLWRISDQSVVKTWPDIVRPSNSFHSSETVCHISWESTTGRLFAIPTGTEIKVYQRSTWNLIMTLSDKDNNNKFGLTAWSTCGTYLAASTIKGKVIVWNTVISRIVSSSVDTSEINICALCWNPVSQMKQLAICDVSGQLSVIENCYSTTSGGNTAPSESITKEKPVKTNQSINFEDDDFPEFDNDKFEDDPDDPDAISLEKIKSDYSFIDGDVVEKVPDDDGGSSVKSFTPPAPRLPLVELQPPFQPTSTPVHLQRRFMVFNDVGYVRHTNTDEENMIDVDFHDVSIHHAFRINNVLNHIMAALSPEALALACEKTEETSSKLVCRLFNSWDDSKEWNVEMTDNESIEAVAIGHKWIAVATNFWYLRVFSLSGVQREIINLPGPILSMSGLNNYLIVVYHNSMGLPDNQNLGFQVFNITGYASAIVPAQPLPLSPKSTLKWVGFSDDLNPCALDSNGILKMYVYKLGSWSPICDVDEQWKESSNHNFVIGVSEERQNIRCITCKGSYYPATTPHPFLTEINWNIPVCEKTMDKGKCEEKLWRSRIAEKCSSNENRALHKEIITTALQLIALCTQTNHEMRAFELCEFMDQVDVTEFGLKYASRVSNNILAEKLSELRAEQLRSAEEEKEEIDLGRSSYPGSHMSNGDYNSPYHRDYETAEPESTNCRSQELFTDSRSTQESSICSNNSPVSLILEMKKKKKSLSEQKNQILPRRKFNPFRKGGLSSSEPSTPEPQLNVNTSSTTNRESQDPLSLPFNEWYEIEKSNLMKEHPDLSEKEVAKIANRMYKALKGSTTEEVTQVEDSSLNENLDDDTSNTPTNSKKRKSTDDVLEKNPEKKKVFNKLSVFAFKKQT